MKITKQSGFSMVEVLLGLVIMGAALIIFLSLQVQQTAVSDGRAKADEMEAIQSVFYQYFLSNRQEILDAMGAASATDANVIKHCVVKVGNTGAAINPGTTPGSSGTNGTLAWSGGAAIATGKKTCTIDLSLLQARGFWPSSMQIVKQSPETGGAWRYAAIFKRVRGPGPDGILGNADDLLTNDAEMLLVKMNESATLTLSADVWKKDTQIRDREMAAVASLGWSGGYFPVGNTGGCSGTRTSANVCGKGWSANLQDWIDPTQYSTITSALPTN